MADMKPILFSTERVKALLEGRKTMTRRLIKPQPGADADLWYAYAGGRKQDIGKWHDRKTGQAWNPPYHADDILYVRETFTKDGGRYYYRADFESDWLDPCETLSGGYPAACRYRNCDTCCAESERIRWRPSIHMPKEAARIFLRVKRVSVERLQKCGEGWCVDIEREGVKTPQDPILYVNDDKFHAALRAEMKKLWDSTIKPSELDTYGWEANPWVWVIEFERISKEEALK